MSLTLGDVLVTLAADSTPLKKGLDEARGVTESWANNLGSKVTAVLGGVVAAGATAAAGAIVGIGAAAFSASKDFDEAQKRLQSQLGATDAEAAALGETVKGVFANNFGDDINDVADSVLAVEQSFQRLGDMSQKAIQSATEDALSLRDAYGVEVAESTGAAAELMGKFGLSADQAFDFLARGYQKGLDGSGDFLDSITEYSTQFANGGADAGQFFSLLETGLQSGVLGTDKAADAFKEFRLRINDGSQLTAQGLEALGINAEAFTTQLRTGAISGADAFEVVLDKLRAVEDPTIRMQAGVALLGTQYEDLGDSVVAGLSLATTSLGDMSGATDKLAKQYDTLPSFFEGLWRRTLVAVTPLTDGLLSALNEARPQIEAVFTSLETAFKNFVANSNFEWSPEFKQIKLGDLFEFVQTNGATTINIADWFDASWDESGLTKLTLGDLFEFVGAETGSMINMANWFNLSWDEAGLTKLKLGDLFEFVSGDTSTVNIGDLFNLSWDEAGLTQLTVGSFFSFAKDGDTRVNLGDYIDVTIDKNKVTKIKVGELIEAEGSTGSELAGSALSNLSVKLGGSLSEAADAIAKALNAPPWLQELVNWKVSDEPPAWLASLLGFDWPDMKEATKGAINSLVAWIFPEAPQTVSDLVAWTFPDAPADISALIAWVWPEFSSGITSAISKITGFNWPKLDAPDWIDQLLNFNIPTPGWVTALLNWSPSLPSLPSWLGGDDSSGTSSSGSIAPSGSAGFAGVSTATAGGKTTNVYVSFDGASIRTDADIEAIAYQVGQRIAVAA